ncbi:putative addiction module antidote [Deinobacterium chartae]|uniref:Putative addiction module antidote n=1 Tax=Deinobacterium chartae TaxID=521158 RepID=A0A841I3W4_9DEIO|nr:hypothetical protein [Deinobacterium chartae]MBB6100003.1 putative addiction module antidote [Deinobacterium chartae]
MERKLTRVGDARALVLSPELLAVLGVQGGDTIDLEVQGDTIVLRAPQEVRDHRARFEAALQHVVTEHEEVLRRLADS